MDYVKQYVLRIVYIVHIVICIYFTYCKRTLAVQVYSSSLLFLLSASDFGKVVIEQRS